MQIYSWAEKTKIQYLIEQHTVSHLEYLAAEFLAQLLHQFVLLVVRQRHVVVVDVAAAGERSQDPRVDIPQTLQHGLTRQVASGHVKPSMRKYVVRMQRNLTYARQ